MLFINVRKFIGLWVSIPFNALLSTNSNDTHSDNYSDYGYNLNIIYNCSIE